MSYLFLSCTECELLLYSSSYAFRARLGSQKNSVALWPSHEQQSECELVRDQTVVWLYFRNASDFFTGTAGTKPFRDHFAACYGTRFKPFVGCVFSCQVGREKSDGGRTSRLNGIGAHDALNWLIWQGLSQMVNIFGVFGQYFCWNAEYIMCSEIPKGILSEFNCLLLCFIYFF